MNTFISLNSTGLTIKGISKNANVIVSNQAYGEFLISRTNFNKIFANNDVGCYNELMGAIVEVPGYSIKMFKTLKF